MNARTLHCLSDTGRMSTFPYVNDPGLTSKPLLLSFDCLIYELFKACGREVEEMDKEVGRVSSNGGFWVHSQAS